MVQAEEQGLIEQFITHPPVEALDKPILHWLASLSLIAGNRLAASG
jgi:hypothetical protein